MPIDLQKLRKDYSDKDIVDNFGSQLGVDVDRIRAEYQPKYKDSTDAIIAENIASQYDALTAKRDTQAKPVNPGEGGAPQRKTVAEIAKIAKEAGLGASQLELPEAAESAAPLPSSISLVPDVARNGLSLLEGDYSRQLKQRADDEFAEKNRQTLATKGFRAASEESLIREAGIQKAGSDAAKKQKTEADLKAVLALRQRMKEKGYSAETIDAVASRQLAEATEKREADEDWAAENEALKAEKALAPDRSLGEAVNDSWQSVAQGGLGIVGGGAYLLGAEDVSRAMLEESALRELDKSQKTQISNKLLEHAKFGENLTETLVQNPLAIMDMVLQSAPMTLPGMGLGRAAAAVTAKRMTAQLGQRAASAARTRLLAQGADAGRVAGQRVVQKAAGKAATAGGVVGEAAVSGGMNGSQAEQQVREMNPIALQANSPRYRELLEQGMAPDEAQETLAQEVGHTTALLTALATSGGGVAAKYINGKANFEQTYSRAVGAPYTLQGHARGLAGESVEELMQNPLETMAGNRAQQAADDTVGLMDDVAKSAALGPVAAFGQSGATQGLGHVLYRARGGAIGDSAPVNTTQQSAQSGVADHLLNEANAQLQQATGGATAGGTSASPVGSPTGSVDLAALQAEADAHSQRSQEFAVLADEARALGDMALAAHFEAQSQSAAAAAKQSLDTLQTENTGLQGIVNRTGITPPAIIPEEAPRTVDGELTPAGSGISAPVEQAASSSKRLPLSAAEVSAGQLDAGNRAAVGLDALRDDEELQPVEANQLSAEQATESTDKPAGEQEMRKRMAYLRGAIAASGDDKLKASAKAELRELTNKINSLKNADQAAVSPEASSGAAPESKALTKNAVASHRLETAKAEILRDIASGKVPDTVRSFSELQDHVDANMYINDYDRPDRMIGPLGKQEGWGANEFADFTNSLVQSLDSWLSSGRVNALGEDNADTSQAQPLAQSGERAKDEPSSEPKKADTEKQPAATGTASPEQAIRDAFNATPVTIGAWKPITVSANGRTQQFLAMQKSINSQGRSTSPIYLVNIKMGRMIAGAEKQPIGQVYKLSGSNNLSEEGGASPASAEQIKAWNDAGFDGLAAPVAPKTGASPTGLNYPNRKLRLEFAKTEDGGDPNAWANIALANLQPGDVVKVGNDSLTVKSVGSKAVTFTKADGKTTRFDVDTPRMEKLVRDVASLLEASHHSSHGRDWVNILSRDPTFGRSNGVISLRDTEAAKPEVNAAPRTEDRRQSDDAPVRQVVLQNRNRSDAAYVQQMTSIAANPDAARLGFSRDFSSGAPVILQDTADIPDNQKGRIDFVVTAEGRRIPVQYAVVEAKTLLPSNRADGTAIHGYEDGIQGMSRVVAGHGRSAALQKAWQQGTATGYAEGVSSDTSLHEVKPASINNLDEPTLVRIMSPNDVTENIGDESNVSGVAQKSAIENARDDARRVDLTALTFGEDGEITAESVRQFVRSMPISEQTGMLGRGGQPTTQAVDRLMGAIFHHSYGSDALTELFAQATDPDARNVLKGLAIAAPSMMQLNSDGIKGTDLDIRSLVAEAAQAVVNAQRRGQKLSEFLQQIDIDSSPEIVPILRMFAENSRSAKRMGDILQGAAEFAYDEATRDVSGGLFGDAAPRATKQQVLERIHDSARSQNLGQQRWAIADGSHAQASAADTRTAGNSAKAQGKQQDSTTREQGQQGRVGTDDFALNAQTEEELAQREAEQQQAEAERQASEQKASQKAQADKDRNDFTLTGSDSAIDEAEARGQGNMFDQRPTTRGERLQEGLIAIDGELNEALGELASALRDLTPPGQLNTLVDPVAMGRVLAVGMKASVLYLQKGAVKFAIWANNMIVGLEGAGIAPDVIKPYLSQLYLASKASVDKSIRSQMDGEDFVLDYDVSAIGSKSEEVQAPSQADEPASTSTGKWFGTRAKADEYIEKKRLSSTHEVVQVGQRFEIHEKPKTLIDFLYKTISSGGMPKDNPALKRLLAEFDGAEPSQYRMKEAQEDLEAAVARHARDIVAKGKGEAETYAALVDLYASQPNLNIRTSTSVENQAYSTPVPLAYMAARAAGIGASTTVYEPTAGNGMLLITATPRLVTANELESQRFGNLVAQGFNAVQGDALKAIESGKVKEKSQDAIITNPPFGSIKDDSGKPTKIAVDGYRIGKIDHLIAAEALRAMKDNGKATLIIGADKVAGGISTDDRIFFNWLYGRYNVTSHFEVDGKLYNRQGAGWPVRVIIIEGRKESSRFSPAPGTIKRVTTWDEVYEQFQVLGTANSGSAAGNSTGSEVGSGSRDDEAEPSRPTRIQAQGAGGGRGRRSRGTDTGSTAGRPEGVGNGNNVLRSDDGRAGENRLEQGVERDAGVAIAASGDAARAKPRSNASGPVEAKNQYQSSYIPRSGNKDEGILIPVNMAQPIQDALSALEDEVGNVDEFAMRELGYNSIKELHGALMGLQVDSVASSIFQMKKGKAIIIADQTGIGKGRQAAAIIRWAKLNGHIPVFVTVKPSLFTDMYNDLADIGSTDIAPLILNKDEWITAPSGEQLFKNNKANHKRVLEQIASTGELPEGSNAVFMTYSQINVQNTQRSALTAIASNAIFILDESHNAGGESATGEFVRTILATAKGVTYLSATFAKRPDNMPVYFKTDIGDATADDAALMAAMEAGGLPLQTVVSNNLVKAGQMFRRERSYDGVSIETKIDTSRRKEHEALSDAATECLRAIVKADHTFHEVYFKAAAEEARANGEGLGASAGNNASSTLSHTEFSSVVHNFVRQMLFSMKADATADAAIAALKAGEKPLIAIESTMGSFLEAYAEAGGLSVGDPITSFSYRSVLSRALERSRYVMHKDKTGNESRMYIPLEELDPITRAAYNDAQKVIDALDINIPASPIDWIRQRLVDAGYSAMEITGRKLRVDYSTRIPTLSRIEAREANDKVHTTRMFNDGSLDCIILNVAGSTGISLHASEKFKDQRVRHMVVSQAAQDINIFMQMLGRVHRTGQVVLPKYTLLNADLPSEKRPTAVLSGKMKSLNANTSSNTESATSVKTPDFLNKYGDKVVAEYLKENIHLSMELGLSTIGTDDEAGQDGLARKATGRLALMPVKVQKQFYDDVEAQYNELIEYLNKTNQNDLEPRTFDLDARELKSQVIVAETNAATPFGLEAVYNEFSVKAQGKPMTPEEIRQAIAEHTDGKSPAEAAASLAAKLSNEFDDFISGIDPESDAIPSMTAVKYEGISIIERHKIGTIMRMDIAGETYNAIVINVRSTHKGSGNPFSKSKIQIQVALNGSLRTLSIPATQIDGVVTSYPLGGDINTMFREQPADEREVAKIITGNLLAAYGEVNGARGAIINFTRADGTIDQGILLPKTFNPKVNLRNDYRFKSAEDALKFLREARGDEVRRFGISSRDGAVRILPDSGGIKIITQKSKARGGKYFTNKALLDVTGDFVSSGQMMTVTVPSGRAVRALNVLASMHALYTLPSMTEDARAIVETAEESGRRIVREGRPAYDYGNAKSGFDNERKASSLQVESQRRSYSPKEQGTLDLFAPSGVPTETAREQSADNFLVHYVHEPVGRLSTGFTQIKTPEQAAHLFAPNRRHAQETMMAAVLDKDDNILHVIRHSKGLKDTASVSPVELVAGIAATKGAAKVWISHNHPSGIASPSGADYNITKRINSALNGTGIELAGHIVVGEGRQAHYFKDSLDSRGILVEPAIRNREASVTERIQRKRIKGEKLDSPSLARQFAQKLEARDAVILLNTQHQVVGTLAMSPREMSFLRDGKQVNRLLSAIDKANVSAIIVKASDTEAATNLARFINNLGDLRLLDVLYEDSGLLRSDAERGTGIAESRGEFYSKSEQWYFSPLTRAVEGMKQETALASQWRAMIEKAPGVKSDELEATGVIEWLQAAGGKVKKSDILDFLADKAVIVNDVMKGEKKFYPEGSLMHPATGEVQSREDWLSDLDPDYLMDEGLSEEEALGRLIDVAGDEVQGDDFSDTEYGKYTVPGGKNYREMLITLPENKDAPIDPADIPDEEPAFDPDDIETLPQQARRLGNYRSGHWDEANILAHVRFDERTDADGKRVLFINEIQSDWGQEGKKKGFKGSKKFTARPDTAGNTGMWEVVDQDGAIETGFVSEYAARRWADGEQSGQGVPAAPFVTKTDAWVSLAIKRMIRYAAENGFDRVAFINGQQAADLFDLSKQVDQLLHHKNSDGTYQLSAITGSRGNMLGKAIPESKLEDYVGKDAAEKIIKGEGKRTQVQGDPGYMMSLSGLDLKVGGEGMRTFYDKIVPKVAGDVIKKLGGGKLRTFNTGESAAREIGDFLASVGRTPGGAAPDAYTAEFDEGRRKWVALDGDFGIVKMFESEEEARDFVAEKNATLTSGNQSFDITPAMRDAALAGLPLFAKGENNGKLTKSALDKRLRSGLLGSFVGRMIDNGSIILHASSPARHADGAEGWTESDGTIHLVANALRPATVLPTLLHELFHRGNKAISGTKAHQKLMKGLESLYKQYKNAPEGSATNEFYKKAVRRVEGAKTKEAQQVEEFGAYAITAFELAPRSVRKWVQEFIGNVKALMLRRLGIQSGDITPAQLRAMAIYALRSAAREQTPSSRIQENGAARATEAYYAQMAREHGISVGQAKAQFHGAERAYGGKEAWQKAKDAGRTKLNYQQWVQVRTPAFKNWFGDWEGDPENASKVVDQTTGEPMVVYHGTTADFDAFDGERANQSSMTGVPKGSHVLSSSPEAASSYAGQFDAQGWDSPESHAHWQELWDKGDYIRANAIMQSHYGTIHTTFDAGGNVMPVFVSLRDPLIVDANNSLWKKIIVNHKEVSTNDLAAKAKSQGSTGLIVRNVRDQAEDITSALPADTVFVFSPNQIKSATGNTGQFGTGTDNIMYQSAYSYTDEELDFLVADGSLSPEHAANLKATAKSRGQNANTRTASTAGRAKQADARGDRAGEVAGRTVAGAAPRSGWEAATAVRGADGKPARIFRGSIDGAVTPDNFKPEQFGKASGYATSGLGVFFSTWHSDAQKYANNTGGRVGSFFLDIRNPRIFTSDQLPEFDSVEQATEFREALRTLGHDGIAIDYTEVKGPVQMVAFDPEQVILPADDGLSQPSRMYSIAEDEQSSPYSNDSEFHKETRRLREKDKTAWSKAKNWWKRNFYAGGLLPEGVFDTKIKRDGAFNAIEHDVTHLTGMLTVMVKKEYGKDLNKLSEADKELMADALAGKWPGDTVKLETRATLLAMRRYIDSLSGEYTRYLADKVAMRLAINPDLNLENDADARLLETITGNIGSYVHRSYRAFDDKNWYKEVPESVIDDAMRYLMGRHIENGETEAEARRRAEVAINEIIKTGTAYDSMDAFIAEGKLGAKDLSILIKRKEIAPEIRALLGEYKDPRLNFAKSATKMARLVWNQRLLDRVRDIGLGTFLFTDDTKPANATVQIAGESSEVYAPLNGLWTTPEIAQAFKDILGKDQLSDLMRHVVAFNAAVKYGKTVLSPTTAMRNIQSALFFTVANGHFDYSKASKAIEAFKEQVLGKTGDAYMRRMLELGVTYDTPNMDELKQWVKESGYFMANEDAIAPRKWLSKLNERVQGFYRFGDDFWKIIGFENEKAVMLKAGLPLAEAEARAAERIRNTYPTYSMIGMGTKWLSRFPLVGTFVSFPAEIIRTSGHIFKYMAQDIRSNNKQIRAMGARKLVGAALVSGGFYALSALTKAAFDMDDDDEEVIRVMAPEWSKNSTFLFWGRNEKTGQMEYTDLSFLDPYGYWKRPITAMMRDQPWDEALASGMRDMLAPFFSLDITTNTILEVIRNKKASGSSVYDETASRMAITGQVSEYIAKSLSPNFIGNIQRTYSASKDEKKANGQPYVMKDEMMALVGWRHSTTDPRAAIRYRAMDYLEQNRIASGALNRVLREQNTLPDERIIKAVEQSVEAKQRIYKDMSMVIKAAMKSGMDDIDVEDILRAGSISKDAAISLTEGEMPEVKLSMTSIKKAVQAAEAAGDYDRVDELYRRYDVAQDALDALGAKLEDEQK